MKKVYCILVMVVLLVIVNAASAEYYQYTDQDGIVRFTDDPSQVPENEKKDARTYESLKTSPEKVSPKPEIIMENDRRSQKWKEQYGEKAPDPTTWDGRLRINETQLDSIKERLDKTFEDIEAQRVKLRAEAPGQDAPSAAINAYEDKVILFNKKIDKYEKDCQAFKAKVRQFNVQLSAKKRR